MKAKLEAGMTLDLLTAEEVRRELQGWQAELTRGIVFRTLSARADLAGGVYSMSVNPAAGMVWSLTRVTVGGSGIVLGTDPFNVYFDQAQASTAILTGQIRQKEWDPGVTIVNGPRNLVIAGAGSGTGTDVFASISVIEVPTQLAWQLI